MEQIKSNGLHVIDYGGNGEPLIFIHAFPLCNRMWDKQAEFFKDKYRVIIYDVRGLGYSTLPERCIYTMEDFANDFFSVLNHFGLDKVNACGLSMGGYILLRAVVRNPDKFSSLILCDTKAERDNNDGILNRSKGIKLLREGEKDTFLDNFHKNFFPNDTKADEVTINWVREIMSWQSREGIANALNAIATRTDTLDFLKDVDVPSLIIYGENDKLTPFQDAEKMHQALKNSIIIKISNAGHLSNMENPEEFNGAIKTFLNNIKTN